ncbi:Protein O-glucosyltransferase 2 [Rhodotorula toruloides]
MAVTSISQRKAHKAHFGAPSSVRRILMSAPLSKELRAEHGVRSIPIRKDDEVKIVRGTYKGREGRINTSNRKNFRVFVEGVSRDKGNGATVPIPVSASNVVITKIKMDKDRTALLKRKSTKKGEDVEMKAASRFMQVGGFGKDYMGRQEEEQVRLSSDDAGESWTASKDKGKEKECLLFPWREGCEVTPAEAPRDPFEGFEFQEEGGHLYYPAVPAPRKPRRPGERPRLPDSQPVDPSQQPHPIHYLIQQAKEDWSAKLRRQSKTLDEAVAEYERRYKRRPPKGFDQWFAFARKNDFVMVDEFDLVMRQVEPFLALQPSLLRERHEKLQFEEAFWMQDKAYTVDLKTPDDSRHARPQMSVHGPMKTTNDRSDQTLKLLGNIAQFLPEMNFTFTGHDTPWVTMSGEARVKHVEAARAGKFLPADEANDFMDDWAWDGWAQICPPDSPLRQVPSVDERLQKHHIHTEPKRHSFIYDHVEAMDLCSHPDWQLIHGFTAWPGPRPGILYPLFVSTTTSMHSDLLVPPIDQYDRPKGNDPAWEEKKYNKVIWRGTTTGADLNVEHHRKWIPFQSGSVKLPYAPADKPSRLGPVSTLVSRAQALAQEWFDFAFLGSARQCDDPKVCAEFEKDFLWSDWVGENEQNEYKYMLDVDGNGWSGRFHRLMSTNSLVLKSTIFPEWYSDMVQPWVHYVPIQIDFSDLWTTMAFFLGDEDGKGAHDEIAKEIALEGKKWTETHWRWVDMEVYTYRLMLEYARIMNRNEDDPTSWDL